MRMPCTASARARRATLVLRVFGAPRLASALVYSPFATAEIVGTVRRPGPEPDRIDDTVLRDCIEDRGAKTVVNVCSYPVNVRWCAAGSTVRGRSSCAQSVAMRIEPYGGNQARALGDEICWVACRAPESALNSYDGTITTWSCGLDPRVERYRAKIRRGGGRTKPTYPADGGERSKGGRSACIARRATANNRY